MSVRRPIAAAVLTAGLLGWGAARAWRRSGAIFVVVGMTVATCAGLLGFAGPAAGAGPAGIMTVCPPEAAEANCDYTSVARAAANAEPGGTIVIRPGVYREAAVLRAPRLTIRAEPGAHMTGVAAEGKAALVVKGDDTVIEGLECSGIHVPDQNGACVRAEGRNLTLRRVYFHESQIGVLGGRGTVTIEDSRLERMGADSVWGGALGHAIYILHRADTFILRRSEILASEHEGHEVKSRARRTIIENNVVASLSSVDSRQIDVPNGGEVVIRGNVLQKGPRSSNPEFIGIGLERGRHPELDHAVNSTLIEGNTFIDDRAGSARLYRVRDVPPPKFIGNTVVGGAPVSGPANRWYRDRAAAGLAPYPNLPARPLP